jgi:hypothetical protein
MADEIARLSCKCAPVGEGKKVFVNRQSLKDRTTETEPWLNGECTSIAEAGNERFSLYPNPVKDKLVISSRERGQNLYKLIVTDTQGHLLI